MSKQLNFDAKGVDATRDFVRTFFEHSRDADHLKREEFQRVYKMYRLQRDMTKRDKNRSNIFVPKFYTQVETIVPFMVDAMLGVRPYIPIELLNSDMTSIAEAQTDLLDAYLTSPDSGFYEEWTKALKYVVPYGTGFIECYPDYVTRKVIEQVPVYMTGPDGSRQVVDSYPKEVKKVFFQLKVRSYAPWEIYRDPFAKSLADARGIIKFRGLTSARQMKKMAQRGAFPDFDQDGWDVQASYDDPDDWSKKIATDIGVPLPKTDDDMGIWLSFESEDRYIDLWNFSVVLRDQPNPYDHGKINLTKIINTFDPNPFSAWYGIGEGRPVEALCHALNENWDQTFDNHNLTQEGVIYYDEDALSVDQLVMMPGNRIPITPQPGQSIQDAVHEREMRSLPADFYRIPAALDMMVDETMGVHAPLRGQEGQSKTAREAMLLSSKGESRMKLKVKMGEQLGLRDFGEKAISIIDQFAAPDDIIAQIGVERAMLLPAINPAQIDGGYNFAFKGADRMAQEQIRRQDMKDVFQLTAGLPSVRQDWLADRLFETFDIPQEERRKGIIPDEQAMLIQAQHEQMMAQASGAAESTRAVSSGKVLGGNAGYKVGGRDSNEKLGGL
jgi:hypothetical protein